jgi:hypothetical protein
MNDELKDEWRDANDKNKLFIIHSPLKSCP